MSGTNTTPKKKSFGFDDILSILDGKKTRPPARPALPASTDSEAQVSAATEMPEPPKVIALPEDHNLVPKLLSDIDQKNAEIIRLNNDLAGLKYEVREKDFKINHLTLDAASKDLKITELQTAIEGLNAEITRLKAIQPQQPLFITPAQPAAVTAPVTAPQPAEPVAATQQPVQPQQQPLQPLQITQLLDAVQAANAAQQAQPVQAADAAAGARPIREQFTIKEEVVEEDVATIFKRLARAREETPEDGSSVSDAPRRPRSAKMYDL